MSSPSAPSWCTRVRDPSPANRRWWIMRNGGYCRTESASLDSERSHKWGWAKSWTIKYPLVAYCWPQCLPRCQWRHRRIQPGTKSDHGTRLDRDGGGMVLYLASGSLGSSQIGSQFGDEIGDIVVFRRIGDTTNGFVVFVLKGEGDEGIEEEGGEGGGHWPSLRVSSSTLPLAWYPCQLLREDSSLR